MSTLSDIAAHPFFNRFSNTYLCLGILAVFCFVLYANTLTHQYAFDDFPFIVNNEFVQDGISGIPKILTSSYWDGNTKANNVPYFSYRPIPAISFALETSLFGNSAFARHLIQILLYIAACSILFLLIQQLFPNLGNHWILAICLLFAAHPLHTEIVANLKNRDELLGFLWASLALFFLFSKSQKTSILYDGLACVCFVLALLSKETASILIGATLLLFVIQNGQKLKSSIVKCIPPIFALGIWALLRHLVSGGRSIVSEVNAFDNPILFASNAQESMTATVGVLGKMQQLLWFPYSLQYEYGFAEIDPNAIPSAWLIVFVISHLFLLLMTWFFRKNKLAIWGLLIYLVSILLMGNIVFTFPVALAERFLLIPSLYVCLLLVVLLQSERLLSINKSVVSWGILGIVLCLFSIKTISRNPAWKNNASLFKSDIITASKSVRANQHYGNLLMQEYKRNTKDKSKSQKGIQYLKKAIELQPQKLVLQNHIALAEAYLSIDDIDSAKDQLNICLKYDKEDPQLMLALAQVYIKQNEPNKALGALVKVWDKSPNNYQAYMYAGFIYGSNGETDKAIEFLQKAYDLNPNSKDVCRYLAKAYQDNGNAKEAAKYNEKLRRLQR